MVVSFSYEQLNTLKKSDREALMDTTSEVLVDDFKQVMIINIPCENHMFTPSKG